MGELEDILATAGELTNGFNQEKALQVVDAEWGRAAWQDPSPAIYLGVAVTLIPIGLLLTMIVLQDDRRFHGLQFLGVSAVYWLAASLGGATMGQYGFTHHFFYRTIEPTFTPWT